MCREVLGAPESKATEPAQERCSKTDETRPERVFSHEHESTIHHRKHRAGIGAATAETRWRRAGMSGWSQALERTSLDASGAGEAWRTRPWPVPGGRDRPSTTQKAGDAGEHSQKAGRTGAAFAMRRHGLSAAGTENGDPKNGSGMIGVNVLGRPVDRDGRHVANLRERAGHLLLTGSAAATKGSVYRRVRNGSCTAMAGNLSCEGK